LASGLSKPTVPTIGEGDEDEDAAGPPDTPPGGTSGPGGALAGLGPKGHSAILGLVQQRLQGLMGQSSGYIEGLPSGTKKRVLALKGVQSDYEALMFNYKKECLELERKVRHNFVPLPTLVHLSKILHVIGEAHFHSRSLVYRSRRTSF
jgi:nucleosome assembly protein 1-like 1